MTTRARKTSPPRQTAPLSRGTLQAFLAEETESVTGAADRIAAKYSANENLLLELTHLAAASDDETQIKATALLKRYLTNKPNESPSESRPEISPGLLDRILELLPSVLSWEARLQLLQSIGSLPITSHQAEPYCDALLACLEDKNKFVRAWAYAGLHHLAELHPRYRAEVRQILERAARDESAAARARLRQLPALT